MRTHRSTRTRGSITAVTLLLLSACSPIAQEVRGATTTVAPAASTTDVSTTTVASSTAGSSTTSSTRATTTTSTTIASTTPPQPGTVLALDLLALVVVENEHADGYDRDLFGYPKSQGGGCTTRTEVLRRDSLTPAQIDPYGCTVIAGDWWSIYDATMHHLPSELDIDHVVALKEAWDSGAWRWDRAVMIAYANDLTDPRTLRAVTSAVNRDKSDKDPSNWLPPDPNDVCRYVGEWVAIKVRWGLSMDESEFGRVRNLLTGQCDGPRVAPAIP